MTRVLVFGSTGQLAEELKLAAWAKGTELITLDRAQADLSQPQHLASAVHQHAPDAVIIAAAYTAVDKAEDEEALALLVNGEAPGAIAAAAAQCGAPVVHVSTDYVFDGAKDGFYDESDPTAPINAYGRTKLAGEEHLRGANPRHVILRTSWVYSAQGANFLRTMLRLSSREAVNVVGDQHGCPTAAGDLAAAIARVVPALVGPALVGQDAPWGTYHLAGATATTWHGFAESIFNDLAERGLPRPRNNAIATAEYPTPARRPTNSRMSSRRFQEAFGFALPGFEAAVHPIVSEALARA